MTRHARRSVLVAPATAVAVAVAATLLACSDPAASPQVTAPGQPAGAATIAIQGWPLGTTGRLRFYRNATVDNVLAEVPVSAEGVASYALPVPAGLIAFTPTEGLTIDPPDARFQVVITVTTRLGGSETETGEARLGNRIFSPQPAAGDTLGELFYVDRDVTVTGTAAGVGGCTYDQPLKAGWNYVTNHIASDDPFRCTISAAQVMPAGIDWHYVFLGP
jgi:hypothetical protein